MFFSTQRDFRQDILEGLNLKVRGISIKDQFFEKFHSLHDFTRDIQKIFFTPIIDTILILFEISKAICNITLGLVMLTTSCLIFSRDQFNDGKKNLKLGMLNILNTAYYISSIFICTLTYSIIFITRFLGNVGAVLECLIEDLDYSDYNSSSRNYNYDNSTYDFFSDTKHHHHPDGGYCDDNMHHDPHHHCYC